MAVEAHKVVLATDEKKYRTCDELSNFHYTWMVEQTHSYVEHYSLVEKRLLERHPALDPGDIRDAWWTMILKGIAWKFSVQPHEITSSKASAPIPSHFWESQLPIYIT